MKKRHIIDLKCVGLIAFPLIMNASNQSSDNVLCPCVKEEAFSVIVSRDMLEFVVRRKS